jgi:hypothetical protein
VKVRECNTPAKLCSCYYFYFQDDIEIGRDEVEGVNLWVLTRPGRAARSRGIVSGINPKLSYPRQECRAIDAQACCGSIAPAHAALA